MDSRTIAKLLSTLSESPRPIRTFSATETTAPDGATTLKTEIEFSDGPRQPEKEDEKPRPEPKGKIPDWQLATRRAPLFEAGKPQ